MFLVLVIHADLLFLGAPSHDITVSEPLSAFVRFFFTAMSIVCVNVFVLISGWFGIKPSMKSFCNFVFQCLFFLVGIYAIMMVLGLSSLSMKGIAECFVMLRMDWFIKAYIVLYILAPVLNSFVDTTDKKTFQITLVSFFVFQTLYSWVSGAAIFFEQGYSTMSFIGLYLLARYINVYKPRFAFTPPIQHFVVFFIMTIGLTLTSFVLAWIGIPVIYCNLYTYVNPLVIMSALSLLLCFKGIRMQSQFINWCASSSFAIYLLHTNPNIFEPYFKTHVIKIFNNYSGIRCLFFMFVYLILVSFLAILIDQIRKIAWQKIAKKMFR